MTARKINEKWHRAHVMPKNPKREERIRWHAEHSEACGCREVPPSLLVEVKALRRTERAN